MASFTDRARERGVALSFTERKRNRIAEDKAEQARRSKMGTTKNMNDSVITSVAPPKAKEPTFLQKAGGALKNVLTDPLTSIQHMDEYLARNLGAGAARANKNVSDALKSIGGDKVPLVKDALGWVDDLSDRTIAQGDKGIVAQVVQSIPRAASNMGLAFLSGGASVPAQLGGNATLQAAKQVLTSPAFANSMLQSYGGAYGQAREEGADRPQAITRAALQAFPQALIEQAGGVENLPVNAAKQGLLKTIGKAALEEAGEELLQYPFEGLSKKATYAPETPWLSTKEEAVINPIGMGQNALVGGLVGGLFGGGTKIATDGISLPKFNQKAQQAPIQTEQAIQQPTAQQEAAPTAPTSNMAESVGKTTVAPIGGKAQQQAAPTTEAPQQATSRYSSNGNNIRQKGYYGEDYLLTTEGEFISAKKVARDGFYESGEEFHKPFVPKDKEQGNRIAEAFKKADDAYDNGDKQTFDDIRDIITDGIISGNIDASLDQIEAMNINAQQQPAPIGGKAQQTATQQSAPIGGMQDASFDAAPTAELIGGQSTQQEFTPIGGKAETPQGRIYGETPKGDIPDGMKERGFSQNIRTDQAMPDDIRTNFDEDPLAYEQISNKDTLQKAQDIFNKGQAEAEADFYKSIGSKEFRPEDVPLAKLLAKQASEQGDIAKARQILSATAEKLTEAGQFSQAAKILREADPETFLMTIDKQLKKLNKQGQKQYGKKWNDVDLTPGEIDAIKKIPRGDQQAYESTWEQIGERIAKELPSTKMEKFDAWRRMAMLLNPKTHIRNVGGNVIMMGMRKASDTIGAALQKAFVPKGQRTQSVGWSLNKDIVAKVNDNWNTVKKDLLGESRWEIDNLKSLGMEKRIFDKGLPTKAVEALTGKQFDRGALQWLNEFSLKTLNVEDNIFVERAYKDALGQYLQANNMDTVTDEAVAYATRRALEATFKQANELASTLNRWKQKPVVGKLVEGAVPFTKTPANIVMRGIEYSPGGIFKALYDVKAGKTAATVIEDLSKGLTGSAITALGFILASMGWAKVDRDRSPKAEALYSEMGDQTNAINTPLGSYTFDWAQPFAIPLAMGIAAQEAVRSRKDGDNLAQAVIDGIAAGGDTVFNMTMLQNIRQIIGSYGSPTEKIMGIPIDYLEQAIFSAFGQAARTIDPVKRSTYDPNPTKQWLNTVKARVPGLSQTLEPALNIWGEEQTQGGALQQFINPGYFKPRNDDPVTNELARLYSEVNDTDLLPKVAPNSFTKDKVTYTLTAEQKTEFARQMGQENYIDMRAIIHTDRYQNATDDEKAKMLKKIANKNYEDAQKTIIKGAAQ